MKYEIRHTAQFKKDPKLAKKQNRDLDELFKAIEELAEGKTLEAKYRAFQLTSFF